MRLKLVFFIGLYVMVHLPGQAQSQKAPLFILDADTGNEVDDYYALARAILESSWNILCINAVQWESSQWAISETMENSHRLNQVILGEMGKEIPTKRGGVDRMYDWGDQAQHSAAAYEIIKQAKQLDEGDKLNIVALGALTNVASAIYIDPTISSSIRLYWLGTSYDFETEILKRQDFNCLMDPQAIEVLLMSEVEMFVMPVNVAAKMVFTYEETELGLGENNLSRLLLDRWYNHLDGGRKERVLWDLALVQSIIHPEWCEIKEIKTSRDNGSRLINYYSSIDVPKMKAEFFEKLK